MDKFLRCLLLNILMLGLFVSGAFGQGGDECHLAKTCGSCMMINPNCGWCKDVNTTFEGPRCDLLENLNRNGCVNATQEASNLTIVMDEDLQDPVYSSDDEIVEPAVPIAPQRVDLKLRLGDRKTIDVRVLQANDYPVDLYYLMDMSKSMEDDLQSLQNLGSQLAEEMKKITRSFALGLGLFVDKPVLPFINTAPKKIDEPCPGCQKAFSFRNEVSLNQNTSLFEEKVKSSQISMSQSHPEGTLDAIMQAAVCKDDVGWRDNARKLLLVTTDAAFHIEGDGKLAGIIKPNDGNCHLKGNEYADAHLYDYPSLGQLNKRLIDNNIIPIFAISDNHELYEDVSHTIQGATYSSLSSDSGDIVQVVSDKYKEITGSIELAHSAMDGVELRISSNCKEGSSPVHPGDRPICTNVHDGDEISFQVEITATRCVDQTFDIYPIGFDKRLTVSVKVACSCSCELETEINSAQCSNGNGSQVCGICQCKPGRYGDTCECTGSSEENQDQSEKNIFCKPDNTTDILCSGRGQCICGECLCNKPMRQDEVVWGTYCECNNLACPRDNGEICGGSERGECVCRAGGRTQECRCRPGYTGEKCNCPTQTDTCHSSNGLICNAAGKCVCGKCECEADSKYSGPKCDECLTCTDCDLHTDCVQCKLFNNTESFSFEECDMCSQIIKIVEELPEGNNTRNICSLLDGDECAVNFVYEKASDGTIIIYVEEDWGCGHSEFITTGDQVYLVIIYIVLGIVLVGLILILLFRLYTWHLDRIEYQQFLEERGKTEWDDEFVNPIYTSSVCRYANPMYDSKWDVLDISSSGSIHGRGSMRTETVNTIIVFSTTCLSKLTHQAGNLPLTGQSIYIFRTNY
ncbi:Integrin beta-1 [Holothuria leucospilota]|uniref:Integrin beta n=1 Tax=Holothuria leucospilota TaxID=206669 RepID=A0A9Q1BH59_HOLLE|nr:Integrin beta-1 [Holothuria leucospilota]